MTFIRAVIVAFIYLLQIFSWLIVIEALLSWVVDPFHPIMQFIRRFTEPILDPFRRLTERMPMANLPIDISPLLAIIVIQILIAVLQGLV
jgi:YggT family protein